jgi:hypothetical protein
VAGRRKQWKMLQCKRWSKLGGNCGLDQELFLTFSPLHVVLGLR